MFKKIFIWARLIKILRNKIPEREYFINIKNILNKDSFLISRRRLSIVDEHMIYHFVSSGDDFFGKDFMTFWFLLRNYNFIKKEFPNFEIELELKLIELL